MTNRTLKVLILLVAIWVLLLTGCRPRQQTTNLLQTTSSQPLTTPTLTRTAISPASGILNLYNTDPPTLDPAIAGDAASCQLIMEVFSGLVRLDDSLKAVPDIAESWQVSGDGQVYTFKLRRGVDFQNGREVKSSDFKYSWERACDPATGSKTASTYFADIVGVNDELAGKTKEISGVKVIDDYTLQVTIVQPRSYFLDKVSYPCFFAVDQTNVASGEEWWRQPNGTGPFKLKQWQRNQSIILERNDLYYGKQAMVNQVFFHLYAGSAMDLYETGQIDAVGFGTDYIDRVTASDSPFYHQMEITPELSFFYIGFNCNKPPFDDVNVRRAFAMAIDKDRIISQIFRNMVQKADGILPPAMPGFNQNLKGLGFDPLQAQALIKASKYGDVSKLPPITFTVGGEGGLISSDLSAIIDQLRQNLGVEVKVRQLDPDRYTFHLKDELNNLFNSGWVADYPHPQDFLDVLFHGSSEGNTGQYSNPNVDSLLDRANAEQDVNKSFALYQQAEQIIVNDAACIPLSFGKDYILVKPYVKDYQLNPMGFVMLNNISIEPH
jgi:oligopeptide transport system substrate-binding protein